MGSERALAAPGVAALYDFVQRHRRLFVLTGAGVSTGSGIPGYRDADGRWTRAPPVQLFDFLHSPAARRRYWARSSVGWPLVAGAQPNPAHRALCALQAAGRVRLLVTQNVDGLHQKAGSKRLIELHGSLGRVVCIDCGADYSRAEIQHALVAAMPQLPTAASAAADGEADLDCLPLDSFQVPSCARCAGTLKPDVVFFGEGVPRSRVRIALDSLDEADAMLVVGSSLMVYSGYRFCERAAATGKPIAALNLGRTRADHLLALKVDRPCAEALGLLLQALGSGP